MSTFGNQQFTDHEFNSIQAALRKRLGPDFVASRPGPGGQKLHYVEGWRAVELANETFGFDGWGYNVSNMTVDFVDHSAGKFYVGVCSTVRITLKNGAFREDVGYGCVDGMRCKSQAIEKARKESVTDGLKRALKSFGNLLGNCLNDKQYLKYLNQACKQKVDTNYSEQSMATSANISTLPNYKKFTKQPPHIDNDATRQLPPHHRPHFDKIKRLMKTKTSSPIATSIRNPNTSVISTDNDTTKHSIDTTCVSVITDNTAELSFSEIEGSQDAQFWDDVLSNIDESERSVANKTPVSNKYKSRPKHANVITPVRQSPRISSSKRRRVDIPGLTK